MMRSAGNRIFDGLKNRDNPLPLFIASVNVCHRKISLPKAASQTKEMNKSSIRRESGVIPWYNVAHRHS